MKLELKYLVPYLPYELKIKVEYFTQHESNTFRLSPQILDDFIKGGYDVKPILRPLSDLFKLIDWNNNNDPYMIGYKYSISTFKENNKYIYVDEYEADYCSSPKAYVDITSFNWWLFEKHFDVFGLIEQGLAIDINTIK